MAEMLSFADDLLSHGAPAEARTQLLDRLRYLNDYGVNEDTGARAFYVVLLWDSSPHCAGVAWRKPDGRSVFHGGLTYDGPGNQSLTVSLTPQWWGIHT